MNGKNNQTESLMNVTIDEDFEKKSKKSMWDMFPLQSVSKLELYHWFVVGTVCIGAFMAAVDASIINVAMPTLSKAFQGGMGSVEWVSISYLLTLTSLLTLLGSLADKLGRRKFYTIGFTVFIIGSAFCGAATSMVFLIAARVVQGLGAAMLQANSVAIITAAVPAHCRGKAIGIQGSAQAVGLSLGPAIGGMLISGLGWRSIFYVNVPVGIVGTAIAALILPKDKLNKQAKSFDYLGAAIFAPAIILFMMILEDGYKIGWLSQRIILEFVAFILLMVLFAWREKKTQNPMVDLKLLKIPVFVVGNITGMLSYSLMYGVLFLMPFFLEWVKGDSPAVTGIILAVVSMSMAILAIISGGLADKLSPRILTTWGMLIASLGTVLLVTLNISTAVYVYIIGLILVGAGMGIFTPPNNSSVMGSAPQEHLGVAGGILNMSRSMGMSLGVALAGTLYNMFYDHFQTAHLSVLNSRTLSFHLSFWGLAIIGAVATVLSIIRKSNKKNVGGQKFHIELG